MDVLESVVEENMDYTFYFIYGFIALLGFSVLFSLVKVIYHYYKVRAELDVAASADIADVESQSISSAPSDLDRKESNDNNATDSERLYTELNRLRKLVKRLNAMGTFSRDTIGDLSAESTANLNNSTVVSSDLSAFWSSIDFDDFEESTINEGNFLNATTVKSVSPSVSDFSLDTSEVLQHTLHQNISATSSKENALNSVSSAFTHQTNPSEAIAQILAILDSIIVKNKHNTLPVSNNMKEKSTESVNTQYLQPVLRSKCAVETYASHQRSMVPSSSVIMDNTLNSKCKFENSIAVTRPAFRDSETFNSETKFVNMLSPEPKLSGQMIDSQRKISSLNAIQAKTSNEMTTVNNLTASAQSKTFCPGKLSLSKSLDNDKFPRSVYVCVDPNVFVPAQLSELPESTSTISAVSEEPHIIGNSKYFQSQTNVTRQTLSEFVSTVVNRSHSFSNFLDKQLSLSVQPDFLKSYSFNVQSEIPNSKSEKKSDIAGTVLEVPEESKWYPQKTNEKLGKQSENRRNSLRNLHVPLCVDTVVIKSSVSESEMMQRPVLETPSSNISSSGSASFFSPVLENLSPDEKIDWKSPVEPVSDFSLTNKTSHYNEYLILRDNCLWSTPPSP